MACLAAFILALSTTASAGSLTDIKHVVLFMQENRAFDHVNPQGSYLTIYMSDIVF
jgi:phospholipase C